MQDVSGLVPADGAATSDEAAPPRPNEPSWIIVRRDSNERSERIGRICVDYPLSHFRDNRIPARKGVWVSSDSSGSDWRLEWRERIDAI